MQTVPSLIGTGTAVAAAATGLVFGQLAEGQLPPSTRPSSSRRKTTPSRESRPPSASPPFAEDFSSQSQLQPQHPLSNTTNSPRLPRRSSQVQVMPPKTSTWRQSFATQAEGPIGEDQRDSVSSNGSWMRRLSLRPMSQHDSIRSSVGLDSPSIFSHGSGAPILPSSGLSAPPLPPNKLVKRSSAAQNGTNPGTLIHHGSKSQMLTLRRPATSHQRSATLHQLTVEAVPPLPDFSLDRLTRPRARTLANPTQVPVLEISSADDTTTWRSFWHAHVARKASKASPLRGDINASPNAKRINVEQKSHDRAYLVAPKSVMAVSALREISPEIESTAEIENSPQSVENSDVSPRHTPLKSPRRSMSMHFSSPKSWVSRTGSVRSRKRGGADVEGASKRHLSDPTANARPNYAQVGENSSIDESDSREGESSRVESDLAAIFQPPSRKRNLSSPLPPLSRLSSFHFDLNRLGSPSPDSPARPDEALVAGNSTSTLRVNSNVSQARTLDRASTVGSSEYHRGFASGDDDDTDFKTDTPFDSLRTVGSSRRRTIDSPLESMFDESPPSTAGINNKPKRLSIQEILGPAFDGGHGIMEEDEGLTTPVRATYDDAEAHSRLANLEDDGVLDYATPSTELAMKNTDSARLSLDDDDDLDWGREDEFPTFNHLSPPSSMNSRRGSPNLRMALSSISGNGNSEARQEASRERPRSNIFDWAEPPHHDKLEGNGYLLRPKTVHGKQEIDMRGGRSASRKGPTAAHVRSQSVPVVPDPMEGSKSAPKFGTWGLGSKNVSEDWDDDFDFDEEAEVGPSEGKQAENRISMIVPASIQATQPTVKAHSGQIRELSLLVNDLKRLCRLGREMEMLNGPSARLWREAEGIIALASPDDDTPERVASAPTSNGFTPTVVDQRFIDEGFDGGALDHSNHSTEQPGQMRTAVVKDRPLVRRRSVFSPEDDIFGTWPHSDDQLAPLRPQTPEQMGAHTPWNPSSVARSLMESMQLRRRNPNDDDDDDDEDKENEDEDEDEDEDEPTDRLNFDTNSLKELVKRASDLRDALSDLVRKADHITQSPSRTPRRDKNGKNGDGSPAFTRVFNDPASSPPRRLPNSHSSNSVINGGSINASPSGGLNQRMQMMTVS